MFRILLIGIITTALSACATMTIEGNGSKTPQSETGIHTQHGSFYGFVWSAPPEKKCDNRLGLYRARYHTNAAYILATLVSLGFYVPQTVEWWCNAPKKPGGETPYIPGQ